MISFCMMLSGSMSSWLTMIARMSGTADRQAQQAQLCLRGCDGKAERLQNELMRIEKQLAAVSNAKPPHLEEMDRLQQQLAAHFKLYFERCIAAGCVWLYICCLTRVRACMLMHCYRLSL